MRSFGLRFLTSVCAGRPPLRFTKTNTVWWEKRVSLFERFCGSLIVLFYIPLLPLWNSVPCHNPCSFLLAARWIKKPYYYNEITLEHKHRRKKKGTRKCSVIFVCADVWRGACSAATSLRFCTLFPFLMCVLSFLRDQISHSCSLVLITIFLSSFLFRSLCCVAFLVYAACYLQCVLRREKAEAWSSSLRLDSLVWPREI